MMIPDDTSTLYNLGHHILELTKEGTMLITGHPVGDDPLKEGVQLGSDETYRLFVALQALFFKEDVCRD